MHAPMPSMPPEEPEPTPEPIPELLRKRVPSDPPPAGGRAGGAGRESLEVGDFRQGSPFSQWALARYLVGRAITESVGASLLVMAGIVVVLGVLAKTLLDSMLLLVLLIILALGVLLLRWILLAVVRRLTGFARFGPLEGRMTALVDDTKSDVLRELRRIGLPGHVITLPLLALRFLRSARREDTLARLKHFQTDRAVPKARLDEMHLLIRQALSGGVPQTR